MRSLFSGTDSEQIAVNKVIGRGSTSFEFSGPTPFNVQAELYCPLSDFKGLQF